MTLKVLQWNCMYSEDIEAVAQLVKNTGADIVFLQELTNEFTTKHPNTGKYIADTLGYDSHFDYGKMMLPDSTPAQMGMGIFSKTTLARKQKIILQKGTLQAGKITSDERFYLQATLAVNKKEIGLGTTHLPFHPTFRTTPSKQKMVETVGNSSLDYDNYILGADLNATPYTYAARLLRQQRLINAGPAFKYPTWTTKPFSIGSWNYEKNQWRLDYILSKGSLKPKSAEIIDTPLSDHLPILVEFEITE